MDVYAYVEEILKENEKYLLMESGTSLQECVICFKNKPSIGPMIDLEEEEGIETLNVTVLLPCQKHWLCRECIVILATRELEYMVHAGSSHLTCPYPFEGGCKTIAGTPVVLEHIHVIKFLTPEQRQYYQSYVERYAFPNVTLVPCTRCKETLFVDNIVLDRPIGRQLIPCDQTESCVVRRHTFCYTCNQTVTSIFSVCAPCSILSEYKNPHHPNLYFNSNNDTLYKNKDITFDIAYTQLYDLLNDPHSYFICPKCKISMFKTEQCNAVMHHFIERCNACGKIGNSERQTLEATHWTSSDTIGGCPRFLNNYLYSHLDLQCIENQCFNHDLGECTRPEHQASIQLLEWDRHQALVYHAIKSLEPVLRKQVLTALQHKTFQSPLFDLLPSLHVFELIEQKESLYTLYREADVYTHFFNLSTWVETDSPLNMS